MDTSSKVYLYDTKEEVEYDSLTDEEKNALWKKFTENGVNGIGYKIKKEGAAV